MINTPRTQFSHTRHQNYTNPFATNTTRSSTQDQESLQFRPNNQESAMETHEDDSGFCSPPLWKTSPSPPTTPSHPLLNHHRNLSPNSRTQAIAKGQKELMEMVKNMPESSYELSLKDLVEHHMIVPRNNNNQSLQQRKVVKSDKNLLKKSESFENKGLFLKMVIPFNLDFKKKRSFVSDYSGRVCSSGKGEMVKGSGEKDWWKKKFTGSSDSDSSRISGTSTESSGGASSGSGRSYGAGGRKRSGCWSFLLSRHSKTAE